MNGSPDPRHPSRYGRRAAERRAGADDPAGTFSSSTPPRGALAGFWRRFWAMIVDGLVVAVLAAAVSVLFGEQPAFLRQAEGSVEITLSPPSILTNLLYFTYFHATTAGQSIGNRILRIRVLDADTGDSLPLVRAFTRALMSYISGFALLIGYLWMLVDRRKQTWHDKVANSLVVTADAYPPGEFGRWPR